MLSFETPAYLLLLLLLPAAIYFRHFRKGRGGQLSFPFSLWRSEGFRYASGGLRLLLFFGNLAFWAGVFVLLLALAGPVRTTRERIFLSRGVDIVFVLDESPSMLAQDFGQETRYDAAKGVIDDFVARRENDAIGLVTFARDAVLRVPPTLDYPVLLRTLHALHPGTLGNGTAIGMGIAVACLHLEHSQASHKVIVLLTDGENNAGEIEPIAAAGIARTLGVRIDAIGIGSTEGAPIQYTDPETGKHYAGTLSGAYNEKLLESIADLSGGRFFAARSADALANIIRTIDSLETVEKRVTIRTNTIPIHGIFILIGFALVLVEFGIRKIALREVLV